MQYLQLAPGTRNSAHVTLCTSLRVIRMQMIVIHTQIARYNVDTCTPHLKFLFRKPVQNIEQFLFSRAPKAKKSERGALSFLLLSFLPTNYSGIRAARIEGLASSQQQQALANACKTAAAAAAASLRSPTPGAVCKDGGGSSSSSGVHATECRRAESGQKFLHVTATTLQKTLQ